MQTRVHLCPWPVADEVGFPTSLAERHSYSEPWPCMTPFPFWPCKTPEHPQRGPASRWKAKYIESFGSMGMCWETREEEGGKIAPVSPRCVPGSSLASGWKMSRVQLQQGQRSQQPWHGGTFCTFRSPATCGAAQQPRVVHVAELVFHYPNTH